MHEESTLGGHEVLRESHRIFGIRAELFYRSASEGPRISARGYHEHQT